ncbi:hypothetical protein L9H26_13245 [Morganella psychrotolerans]|uniref:Uncharacterized protein n=1 Tax=Morganella psychrotolerans TaxID=368603 RepID=A0A5M9R4T0_9GAMM|nr:hypothetical protein [Morganella psychrotolerans]KAA8714916.1 hypothetical protein F4V73_13865 [Morganella psychrotolerans]OBU04641.1 hypothetical protein AYY16_12885 [Morganella psychrotolerans]
MVDKNNLGHLYPHTVVYQIACNHYILAEDEDANYLIKPILKSGRLGGIIVDKQFRYYYDIIQAAYDEYTSTTFICCVSLSWKAIEIFETHENGLKAKVRTDYVMDDRKTCNFFFIRGQLYLYERGEDANGKYTIKSIRVVFE